MLVVGELIDCYKNNSINWRNYIIHRENKFRKYVKCIKNWLLWEIWLACKFNLLATVQKCITVWLFNNCEILIYVNHLWNFISKLIHFLFDDVCIKLNCNICELNDTMYVHKHNNNKSKKCNKKIWKWHQSEP